MFTIKDDGWAKCERCESFRAKDIGAEEDVGEDGSELELLGDLSFIICPSSSGPSDIKQMSST